MVPRWKRFRFLRRWELWKPCLPSSAARRSSRTSRGSRLLRGHSCSVPQSVVPLLLWARGSRTMDVCPLASRLVRLRRNIPATKQFVCYFINLKIDSLFISKNLLSFKIKKSYFILLQFWRILEYLNVCLHNLTYQFLKIIKW